jgi:hypothetical protein
MDCIVASPPLSRKEKKPRAGARLLVFLPKLRIARWKNKTANFVVAEAVWNQWLLLWISGEELTGAGGRAVSENAVS